MLPCGLVAPAGVNTEEQEVSGLSPLADDSDKGREDSDNLIDINPVLLLCFRVVLWSIGKTYAACC